MFINRASELSGIEESELTRKEKDNPDTLEEITDDKLLYVRKQNREMFLDAHPLYINHSDPFQVHHNLPQELLKRHPDSFTAKEVHCLDNLVGIPNNTGTHSIITNEWKRFFQRTPNRTKDQILDFSKYIDRTYGGSYLQ